MRPKRPEKRLPGTRPSGIMAPRSPLPSAVATSSPVPRRLHPRACLGTTSDPGAHRAGGATGRGSLEQRVAVETLVRHVRVGGQHRPRAIQ
jgi:hypothetical protein